MRENIYFHFMHTLVLFNATTAFTISHHQLVAAAGGDANTCIDKERQALLDFQDQLSYYYFVADIWSPEEDDCCQWEGVTCNTQTGHVTELNLSNPDDQYDGLEGEISLSLLNLTYLNHLSLSKNSFYGTIPKFIGSMTHLTHLDLGQNHLSGTIPESIGNMTHLTYLDLGENYLTGTIPESIGNMTHLTHLDLGQNYLTGTVPESIGNMTHLTHLDLGQNNLTGTIPESIGNIGHLTFLDLGENNFCGTIPRSVGSLTKLTHLDLSKNSLNRAIPPELGNLTNLVELSLSVENLDWLSSMSKLEELNLDGSSLDKANHWVDLIIGLQNLSSLSLRGCDISQVMHLYSSSANYSSSVISLYLDNSNLNSSMFPWLCPLMGNNLVSLNISGNKYDGKLSDFLNNLSACASSVTRLDTLHASSNQFTGSLSDEIQNFSSLAVLNLASNQLDGTISDKLWQLIDLQYLDLSFNRLRGPISELTQVSRIDQLKLSNNLIEGFPFTSNWEELSYIDFRSNKLGPRFPEGIQTLNGLIHLDLSNNNISDTFPTNGQFYLLSSLGYFNLSFNNMSGKLPDFQSNVDLKIVDLSSNNFHGRVPVFPAYISYLDLSRNKFHGRISFLCHLYERLEFLDLSNNSLTGPLPDCLRNFTTLRVLNLGHNFLSGKLPPSIRYLSQLEMLCLYNNSFSGKLHSYLKNCTKLSLLDLGANKFSGNVPVWIGENLPSLYVLNLRSNNLFGNIPLQICHLITLQILDLSKNNLHGTIPPCVNNLTAMVQKGLYVKKNVHQFHAALVEDRVYDFAEMVDNSYFDHLLIEWQGKVREFSSILGLVKTIDLSSNNLTGKIPYEVTNLHGLLRLDLSNNSLVGEIPRDIGQMKALLTLNLSRNFFSGKMPSGMSDMDLLNDLDVSYNNLSGRVPSSTQLQSFPPEWFTGNVGLCGPPTGKKCVEDEDLGVPPVGDSDGDAESTDELQRWFYIGGATGFTTAFWIACSALLFNRRLRHAFFRLHDCLKDWVYVKVLLFVAKLQRVARA
ncbi:leucine-rich repeat-containing protein [Tanacetum coccineum]